MFILGQLGKVKFKDCAIGPGKVREVGENTLEKYIKKTRGKSTRSEKKYRKESFKNQSHPPSPNSLKRLL